MYLRSVVTAYITNASGHIGKTLNCFGKVLNGFFCVAVFNAVAHAVLNMPFQHNLPYAVQCRFGGVNLHKNVLAGHIFVNHSVNSLHLADNFFAGGGADCQHPYIVSSNTSHQGVRRQF